MEFFFDFCIHTLFPIRVVGLEPLKSREAKSETKGIDEKERVAMAEEKVLCAETVLVPGGKGAFSKATGK